MPSSFALFLSFLLVTFAAASDSSSSLYTLPLIPHHKQQERRRHLVQKNVPRRREQALQVGALYQGYGTHYVDLWVGTPNPQRQTVIVDTGSGVTAFPCNPCEDCGEGHHIDDFFEPSSSETFEKVPCGQCMRGTCRGGNECSLGMSYQEGSSWSAYEARDTTYAGGLHERSIPVPTAGDDVDPHHASALAFPLVFGCQTRITGLFKTQLADGIMGMDNADTSYWSQMTRAGVMKQHSFSLCYSRPPTATRAGTEAGALTFGGADQRLHTSPMVYSGGHQGRIGFFSVRMRKIYLREGAGGESATANQESPSKVVKLDVSDATLNSASIIVDSGTTDTYFTHAISNAFDKAFKELTGHSYSHDAVDLTPEQLEALPTILFQIQGDETANEGLYGDNYVTGLAGQELDKDHPYDVILAMPPSHYMEYDSKKGKYVARFYTDEGAGSVLGGNAIMGHDVYFDIDAGHIGWAESHCDYTKLVEAFEFDVPSDQASQKKQEEEDPAIIDNNDSGNDSGSGDTKDTPQKEHDSDTPSKDIHPPSTESTTTTTSTGGKVCSDASCRFGIVAAMVGVLAAGFLMGRAMSRRSQVRYQQQATELEVPTMSLDSGPRYRDHPDDVAAAAEAGIGYEDDDELEEHEIA